MRILLIRHGDPDYASDSLTPAGKEEAVLLSERLLKTPIDHIYVSPLGRAQETAAAYLSRAGKSSVTVPLFREFINPVTDPETGKQLPFPWDLQPGYWTKQELFYTQSSWRNHPMMSSGSIGNIYDEVCSTLDQILSDHGYDRQGNMYEAREANHETIAIFCHLGTICVLLSHLLGISPVILWHAISAPASSVTTLYTEERLKGQALFRCQSIGDISHLYAAGKEPSFCCRFCEIYDDVDVRH